MGRWREGVTALFVFRFKVFSGYGPEWCRQACCCTAEVHIWSVFLVPLRGYVYLIFVFFVYIQCLAVVGTLLAKS